MQFDFKHLLTSLAVFCEWISVEEGEINAHAV
jgi:hypothetical protein